VVFIKKIKMLANQRKNKSTALRLLFRYKLQKFSWKFKQIFLFFLGTIILYWVYTRFSTYGRDLYLLYWVAWIWLIPFWYGIKWIFFMFTGGLLRSSIFNSWAKIEAVVYKVEYIESWSIYQKWTFIFARPKGWLLEGMGYIFKSERLNFRLPSTVLKPWDTVTVFVSKKNISNYFIDIKDIFYRALE